MGENEQGGMLRVVVVLGLIALIATVLIGGVASANGAFHAKLMNATALIDNAGSITESDVPEGAWQKWNGGVVTVKAGQHLAVRATVGRDALSDNDNVIADLLMNASAWSNTILLTDTDTWDKSTELSMLSTDRSVTIDGGSQLSISDDQFKVAPSDLVNYVIDNMDVSDLNEDALSKVNDLSTLKELMLFVTDISNLDASAMTDTQISNLESLHEQYLSESESELSDQFSIVTEGYYLKPGHDYHLFASTTIDSSHFNADRKQKEISEDKVQGKYADKPDISLDSDATYKANILDVFQRNLNLLTTDNVEVAVW